MARSRKQETDIEEPLASPVAPSVIPEIVYLDAIERVMFRGDHRDPDLAMQRTIFRCVRTCAGDDPFLVLSMLVGQLWRRWLRGECQTLRVIAEFLDPLTAPGHES
jgi:hypothetical protein